MTWKNLPCPPTLAALASHCPDGWVEVEYTYSAGNPTADPPQDADLTIGFGRWWGVEDSNLDAVRSAVAKLDLVEPPIGLPSRDLTLLVRVEAGAGPCNICGRKREDGEVEWTCSDADGECMGMFIYEVRAHAAWGPGNLPVYFEGGDPKYEEESAELRVTRLRAESAEAIARAYGASLLRQ